MQDVRVAEPVGLVEEQQDDHLVRAHVELVALLPKRRPHVCAAHGGSVDAGGTLSTQDSSGAAAALEADQASHTHIAELMIEPGHEGPTSEWRQLINARKCLCKSMACQVSD